MSPATFLTASLKAELRALVAELLRLAAATAVPGASWADQLRDDPFTMPRALAGAAGGARLSARFDALRAQLGDQPSDVARRQARAVVTELLESSTTGPDTRTLGGLSPERRWLIAGIAGNDGRTPLELETDYLLEISVALAKKGALANSMLPDPALWFADDEQVVELTVQLDSSDVDIAQRTMPLKVPRTGPSIGKARFDIRPLHAGACVVVATVHKSGNFLTQLELTLAVGADTGVEHASAVAGRPLDGAPLLESRDIGLSIAPAAGGGYDCTVWGAGQAAVRLPISSALLAQTITNARDGLMRVVMQRAADGELAFQRDVAIAREDADTALTTLRDAGALLFQRMFYASNAGPDVNAVGDFLRAQAMDATSTLKIQIVARDFPVPWPLLYVGPPTGPVDWQAFLGMRHVIEQIPLQPRLNVPRPTIASDAPSLAVSVNVNAGIDAEMQADHVQRQRDYWHALAGHGGVRVVERQRRDELRDALATPASDQIMYLYCHAATTGPGDRDGVDSSCLVLSNGERLTLAQLLLEAPSSTQLPGHPLVVINACESAELSPLFYDGFVPYFMSKGARGVIGTECRTPALFATEWALRFFPRLFAGERVGEAILALRRDAWETWNNPLGLLYAVHCNADTRVEPAVG